MERVDSLVKPRAGRRDPQVEGASPLTSLCTSRPFSGDNQDGLNTAEEKVKDKATHSSFSLLVTVSLIYY